jgi:hypothetical protein
MEVSYCLWGSLFIHVSFTVNPYLLLFVFSMWNTLLKLPSVMYSNCCGSSKVLLPWHLIDQKVHIKMKAKSQPESKNAANTFELDNGCASKVHPIDSTGNQSLCCCKYCYEFGDIFILMPSFPLNFLRGRWSLCLVFEWYCVSILACNA